MLSALALAALVSAINPWNLNDPFPLPPTYDSVLRRGDVTANLGYRGVFENFEVEGAREPRPYEAWTFFQEANPFVRWALSPNAELKAGARIKAELGGETQVLPRIAYVDDRPKHTIIFGYYRASWNPGLLYQPLGADDHAGVLLRFGRRLRAEAMLSRPGAVGNNRYERYVAAARFGWNGELLRLEAQGLIDHAAGFDTADLPYRRPGLPTHQILQNGFYGEINFLGRRSGVHAEFQHASGEAVWAGKRWKPHGRYRAAGGHLNVASLTLFGEYRRVDPTFVAPMGAHEYRLRYPADRVRAPDEAVGMARWFYPFHTNGSLNVEVEQAFFLKKRTLRAVGNQNRIAVALQAQF